MFNIYELGKTSSYPHSVLNLFIQTQHQEQKCAKTFGRNVCALNKNLHMHITTIFCSNHLKLHLTLEPILTKGIYLQNRLKPKMMAKK